MDVYVDTQNAFYPTKTNQKFSFKGRAIVVIPSSHIILSKVVDDPSLWVAVIDPKKQNPCLPIFFSQMMIVPLEETMDAALLN